MDAEAAKGNKFKLKLSPVAIFEVLVITGLDAPEETVLAEVTLRRAGPKGPGRSNPSEISAESISSILQLLPARF